MNQKPETNLPLAVDTARQAIDALRGYAYQLYVSSVAWVELAENELLALEVAEDYATLVGDTITATQVKDTKLGGTITSNSEAFSQTIESFVDLVERNPQKRVSLRFLSTSEIGREKLIDDRIDGQPCLIYWRLAAKFAPVAPLRDRLLSLSLTQRVKSYIEKFDDEGLRENLLQRIHWDCGQPPLEEVQRELDQLLVYLGNQSGLKPSEARAARPSVLERLLSVAINRDARTLSKADLLETLEAATHVSVPRAHFQQFVDVAQSGLTSAASGVREVAGSIYRTSSAIPTSELPRAKVLIPRPELERRIAAGLAANGLCWVHGQTGFGKTQLARCVAENLGGDWRVVSLLDLPPEAVSERLNSLLFEIIDENLSGLILDDLQPHAKNSLAMARLVGAARRRDKGLLVTSYKPLPQRTILELGLDTFAGVEAEGFTEEETKALVSELGGEPGTWGRYVHLAGGGGHPLLTAILAMDFQSTGWPASEFEGLKSIVGANAGVKAARDEALRRLVDEMEPDVRILLARLSISVAPVDQSAALKLAQLTPEVNDPARAIEVLSGRWMENVGNSRYRTSPLVSGIAAKTLTKEQQAQCHHLIADEVMSERPLDASRVNGAFLNALLGKNELALVRIAVSVAAADRESQEFLAEELFSLRMLTTEKSAYKENAFLSAQLRLAQLLLLVTHQDERVRDCWDRLQHEIALIEDEEVQSHIELMALSKLLISDSVVGKIPDIPALLLRLRGLGEAASDISSFDNEVEGPESSAEGPVTATELLFITQAAHIPNVAALETFIKDLDQLSETERNVLLGGIFRGFYDADLMISHPWVAEVGDDSLDANSAIAAYQRITEITKQWQDKRFAIAATVTEAVLNDEYLADPDTALEVIKHGEAKFGNHTTLTRARARVLYRSEKHGEHIKIAEGLIGTHKPNQTAEQMHLVREVAISAAELGDWSRAAELFDYAYRIREDIAAIEDGEDLFLMRIGLLADAAIAEWHVGDTTQALKKITEALRISWHLDPDHSYAVLALKRLIGQAIVWISSQKGDRQLLIDGQAPKIAPGFVSTPNPAKGMDELPVGLPEYQWYLLASADIALNQRAGIRAELNEFLPLERRILYQEIALWADELGAAVHRSEPYLFLEVLPAFAAGQALFRKVYQDIKSRGISNPEFGLVEPEVLEKIENYQALCVSAIAAFVIHAISTGATTAGDFEAAANKNSEMLGSAFIEALREDHSAADNWFSAFLGLSKAALGHSSKPLSAEDLFLVCLRLLEAIQRFERVLPFEMEHELAKWVQKQWLDYASNRRFLLRNPMLTVTSIQGACSGEIKTAGDIARILLAAEPATKISLGEEYRQFLQEGSQQQ